MRHHQGQDRGNRHPQRSNQSHSMSEDSRDRKTDGGGQEVDQDKLDEAWASRQRERERSGAVTDYGMNGRNDQFSEDSEKGGNTDYVDNNERGVRQQGKSRNAGDRHADNNKDKRQARDNQDDERSGSTDRDLPNRDY